MSQVTTRASIKYLSIKFFLKFFSVSWSRTHSENRESWNLPQPFLTNGSSLQKNYLCLKLFVGDRLVEFVKRKKTLMFICCKWNNTSFTQRIFCNGLLLLFDQLLSVLDALRSCRYPPFVTFLSGALIYYYLLVAGFSDWLALSSILEGNALEKRCLDTLPDIKTACTVTSYCATTPSCDANCTVIPCHPLILAIMIPCAVIHMTCLSLFCYLKPQVRSKLTGSSPSQATAFVNENWDDQIISMKKVTSTKEHSTGQTILENNHSSKRDWRQAENWKDTLQIWL